MSSAESAHSVVSVKVQMKVHTIVTLGNWCFGQLKFEQFHFITFDVTEIIAEWVTNSIHTDQTIRTFRLKVPYQGLP